MAINVRVLFDQPQQAIASLLRHHLRQCSRVWIVVGFATVEGLESIAPTLLAPPNKLQTLVIGAGTFKGFATMDKLLAAGVPSDRLWVHLGHTRDSKTSTHFQKYHPMLHSKIYYMEMPNGEVVAFIGSHNLTGFALNGSNGEAAVMLEGAANDAEFQKIRDHIAISQRQAIPYSADMKDALTWWTRQFVEGLRRKVDDEPDDLKSAPTVVLLAAKAGKDQPRKGEKIYFEIPEALPQIRDMSTEVHIYVFDQLPKTPSLALSTLNKARYTLWCKTRGLELKKGGKELDAQWELTPRHAPQLCRTSLPFRPTPAAGMQQVRVEVFYGIKGQFEYFFERGITAWAPVYDQKQIIRASPEEEALLHNLDLEQPEHGEWYLVRGLEPVGQKGRKKYLEALRLASPESGSYILMARWRREVSESE